MEPKGLAVGLAVGDGVGRGVVAADCGVGLFVGVGRGVFTIGCGVGRPVLTTGCRVGRGVDPSQSYFSVTTMLSYPALSSRTVVAVTCVLNLSLSSPSFL